MFGWLAGGVAVMLFAGALALASSRFGYAYQVAEMPVLALAGGLVAAGLVYMAGVLALVRALPGGTPVGFPFRSHGMRRDPPPRHGLGHAPHGRGGGLGREWRRCASRQRALLVWIVATGLLARLILFASEPILEDDYQRYLWDGAVVAQGLNPYTVLPEAVLDLASSAGQTPAGSEDLVRLAGESGPVLGRINHPELRTVYPPVAQGAFALAHAITPWSLTAWRSVILAADTATLVFLVLLLGACGRSPLWAALYWWNPLVLKESFNAAHMDAIVPPLVLGALWCVARGWQVLGAGTIMLAAGAKIWPVLLLPLALRPLLHDRRRLAAALVIVAGLGAALAVPLLAAPLDEASGFAAYLERWRTNSALLPVLEQAAAWFLGAADPRAPTPALAARGLIAALLCGWALFLARGPIADAADLVRRAALVVAALVLLSPAQFPWYALWLAPFLAFHPWTGFLLLCATIPLYYADFHFLARDQRDALAVIPWLVWVPVWAVLAWEAVRGSRQPAAGSGYV